MIGLALGVDYALLMVWVPPRRAGERDLTPWKRRPSTRRTAGRTTAFAGGALLLSMVGAFFVVPGSLLASLAATVTLVVVLSVLVAETIAGPAPARPARPEPGPLAVRRRSGRRALPA